MDRLGWIALVQPFILVSLYTAFQYVGPLLYDDPSEVLATTEDTVTDVDQAMDERVSRIEEQVYIKTEAGPFIERIGALEDRLLQLSEYLSQMRQDIENSDTDSGSLEARHNTGTQIQLCFIAFVVLQLITTLLVLILWYRLSKAPSKHVGQCQDNTPATNNNGQHVSSLESQREIAPAEKNGQHINSLTSQSETAPAENNGKYVSSSQHNTPAIDNNGLHVTPGQPNTPPPENNGLDLTSLAE